MAHYKEYEKTMIEIHQLSHQAYIGRCVNDNRLSARQSLHAPLADRADTNIALMELADILEETKGHIGAANSFPMWITSLVGYYSSQQSINIEYRFCPERDIDLCKHCLSQMWGRIAAFKEKWPELFMPMIKEPEME